MSDWKTYGGTLTGPYHHRFGLPNQDAMAHREWPGFLAAAVADGAGSLQDSLEGAELAARVAVDSLSSVGHEDPVLAVEEAIAAAREALLAAPRAATMGCTLAVCLSTPTGSAIGVVGDAFAVSLLDGELTLVTGIASGEYANQTQLLTSSECTPVLRGWESSLEGFALASDGMERPSLSEGEPLPGFWLPIFAMAREGSLSVGELLLHMDSKELIEDDTTLLLAVPA